MRRAVLFSAFVILGAVAMALSACGGDSGTNSNAQGDFAVTVSTGTTPTYTWGAGNAFSVSVVRVSNPANIVWGLSSPSEAITSPVTHGSGGSGFTTIIQTANTEPSLTAGVTYQVSVTRLNGQTGWKQFTP